jgi:hypothetical protein
MRMEYKGFTGSVSWSEVDGVWCGKLEHISPLVNYEAPTPSELKTAFEEAVNDYISGKERMNVSNFKKFTFELWFCGIDPHTAHAIEQISRGEGDLEVLATDAGVVKLAVVRHAHAGKGALGALTSVVFGAISDVVDVFPAAILNGIKFGTQSDAESILFWESIAVNNSMLGSEPFTFSVIQEYALSCKEEV